jgi:hypothetical protein
MKPRETTSRLPSNFAGKEKHPRGVGHASAFALFEAFNYLGVHRFLVSIVIEEAFVNA